MSFSNNDIHNAAGPGSSAEPSMEEILASIRRILKDDEPGAIAPPPVDMDDDILVLDQSMIAKPADVSTATSLPDEPRPAGEHPATPIQPISEPLHFSSEAVPFSRDIEPAGAAVPEALVDLPAEIPPAPDPLPRTDAPAAVSFYRPAPPPRPEPAAEPQAEHDIFGAALAFPATPPPASETTERPEFGGDLDFTVPPQPEPFRPAAFTPHNDFYRPAPPAPKYEAPPAPEPEPQMTNPQDNVEPPESLISDKTTDAAASSIGALVRSMSTEKAVAISKNGSITIEDIVREEIRPLLKSWLDSHLPSLVERVVRAEIERVISRTVV
jgi:cell pole-organizing protein PopZ